MKLKNTDTSWGLISILVHWVAAIVIIALFASGLWMMDLGYGSPWYQKAPHWHKSVGVLIISLMIFRYLWKLFSGSPAAIANHKPWEKKLSTITHLLLYVLVISMFITGYLIVTAGGRGLDVFDWFVIPSVLEQDGLEDIAGEVHEIIAFIIIGLAAFHALGALKHHFIDKDETLRRMLGKSK